MIVWQFNSTASRCRQGPPQPNQEFGGIQTGIERHRCKGGVVSCACHCGVVLRPALLVCYSQVNRYHLFKDFFSGLCCLQIEHSSAGIAYSQAFLPTGRSRVQGQFVPSRCNKCFLCIRPDMTALCRS